MAVDKILGEEREKLLAEESIGKLLARLSLPASIGLIVYSLYNLVDTIFLGRFVGSMAIGGLAVAFPVQILAMAVGVMLGVGAASVISRSLGAGDRERAYKAGGNALIMSLGFGLVLMILGEIFIEPLLILFGATEELLPYARDYLSIILLGTVFTSTTMAGYYIINSEGQAKSAMWVLVISMGMNIVLDPIFIVVFQMGIKGAALATVLAQVFSTLFVVRYFIKGKGSLQIRVKHFKPDLSVLGETLALGMTVFCRQAAKTILFIVVNNVLKVYSGSMGISAFGIIFRILAFMIVPIMGVGQGFQPIAGFNYGAKNWDRVRSVVKKTLLITTILATVICAVMILLPRPLLGIFTDEEPLIKEAVPALRIIVMMIPLIGIQTVSTLYFFAIGKVIPALILSLTRHVLFLTPLVLVLPLFWGITGVWLAFPAADLLSVITAGGLLIWEFRRKNGVYVNGKSH